MSYLIGFWIAFSFIIAIMAFFIWLCIQKSVDDRIMQISSIGLEYLITQYLLKCFQKTSYLLLQSSKSLTKISANDVSIQQEKFVQNNSAILTKKLLSFVRGSEIVQQIHQCIKKNNFHDINLFIFPDIIIHNLDYYKNMLYLASEKIVNPPIDVSDQEAKLYIDKICIKEDSNIIIHQV